MEFEIEIFQAWKVMESDLLKINQMVLTHVLVFSLYNNAMDYRFSTLT